MNSPYLRTYCNQNQNYLTGMFKDDEDCNDKPVTISATIMNNYGNVTPPRKNPTFIRAKEWRIDSKVVSVKVSNMRVKK